MTACGARSLLAASAAAAILSYGVVGHGLSHTTADHGMAGVVAGLCLLLATVLGVATSTQPVVEDRPAARAGMPIALSAATLPPLDNRARASPTTLQRFRN